MAHYNLVVHTFTNHNKMITFIKNKRSIFPLKGEKELLNSFLDQGSTSWVGSYLSYFVDWSKNKSGKKKKTVIVLSKETLRKGKKKKKRNLKQASSPSLIGRLLHSQCDSDYSTLSPLVPKETPIPKGISILPTFKTNSQQQ